MKTRVSPCDMAENYFEERLHMDNINALEIKSLA